MNNLLSNNIRILEKHIPNIKEIAKQLANHSKVGNLQVTLTKTGDPSVSTENGVQSMFIHSKYDPRKEAKAWAKQYKEELKDKNHVLVYGLGLGYHVEELIKELPDLKITLYEPQPALFYTFLSSRDLSEFPISSLKQLFIEFQIEDAKPFLYKLLSSIAEDLRVLELPSYTRIFANKYKEFMNVLHEMVQTKRLNIHTDVAYATRWSLNSLMNLSYTATTPNLLADNMSHMQGKPVLIVSAGPGLSYEYENLRNIKRENMAYIIAVGSANKALVNEGIFPDAVATYDPQKHNAWVFSPIIREEINSIPIIYGTSVGFETLERFPGEKYHTVTNKDTVSPYYLKLENNQQWDIVNDAPSIAVVIYQLVSKWGCSPIILVGQNFCIENQYRYAKETEYNGSSAKLDTDKPEKLYKVENIDGQIVETTSGFIAMKNDMELYIGMNEQLKTINTTQGGLDIVGAPYSPLKEVIDQILCQNIHVDQPFLPKAKSSYNMNVLIKKIDIMEKAIYDYSTIQLNSAKLLRAIEDHHDHRQNNKLIKDFQKFDKLWFAMIENDFFNVYIRPILQMKYEILVNRAALIQQENNVFQRAKMLIKEFGNFFEQCKEAKDYILLTVKIVHRKLLNSTLESNEWKEHLCHNGLFKYSNSYKYKSYKPAETSSIIIPEVSLEGIGEKISFDVQDSIVRLKFHKDVNGSDRVKVIINGEQQMISLKQADLSVNELPEEYVIVQRLDQTKRNKVEIINEAKGVLRLIQVDTTELGRVYHSDEVLNINELIVGKRIRCYYEKQGNDLVAIKNIFQETSKMMPYSSKGDISGDFFLVYIGRRNKENCFVADRDIHEDVLGDSLFIGTIYEDNFKVKPTNEQAKVNYCNQDYKNYDNHSGVIKYIGEWHREQYFQSNIFNYRLANSYKYIVTQSNQMGAKIKFKFTGTQLRIICAKSSEHSEIIKITIDGQVDCFSQKTDTGTVDEPEVIQTVVYERNDLPNNEHEVEIEALGSGWVSINAIEIDKYGRLHHVDEVKDVSELEIGKRIRCNYKASLNEVGDFAGLGEETGEFIPISSSAYPNGDFYFIMVDYDENEKKKLIADRNIHHSISWDALNQAEMINGKETIIGYNLFNVRLLTGGVAFADKENNMSHRLIDKTYGAWPVSSEWDKYIVNSDLCGKIYNGDNMVWNWHRMGSWMKECANTETIHPMTNEINALESKSARGYWYLEYFTFVPKSELRISLGFRPIILYLEREIKNEC